MRALRFPSGGPGSRVTAGHLGEAPLLSGVDRRVACVLAWLAILLSRRDGDQVIVRGRRVSAEREVAVGDDRLERL